MILRELLASFGINFDHHGAEEAEHSIDHLSHAAETLGAAFEETLLAAGLEHIVEAASHAEESLVRVKALFGESGEDVVAWSETAAHGVGRTAATLQGLASQVGAVVNSFAKGDEEAATMSETVAGLAVNLGAFFGSSDEEALAALRSGLLGMDRPLKQYGIRLGDAALEEYALAHGIGKAVKDMTEQQKAQLRYKLLLSQTEKVQGAAAKSLDRFSGANKALHEAFDELAETAGSKVLGPIVALFNWIRSGIDWFLEIAKGTHVFEAALGVLAVAAAVTLIPLLPLIGTILGIAFAIALATLFLDDFYTFLTGGTSALEDVLNMVSEKLFGSTVPASALLAVIKSLADIIGYLGNVAAAVFLAMTGDLSGVKLLWDEFKQSILAVWQTLKEVFAGVKSVVGDKLSAMIGLKSEQDMIADGSARYVKSGSQGGLTQQNETNIELNVTGSAADDPEALAGLIDDRVNTVLDNHYEAAAGALLPGVSQ